MLGLSSGNVEPQEFSADATQNAIQKLTLWQLDVARLTHEPPKTKNWTYSGLENKQKLTYSGLENKQTAKHV